ncbi:MAG: UDP-N-acetylmuramoyl-L-alanyl-D-glutamate--2,6-diaminopimelate ligase [Candidatus Melainabacteria bacterium]|nr:UDP-N-acetylmuramoyl-L-alanyl-D-glutamate--2,6-diaminopimelate ligase [Candidatus Melainabacteria bacterium]
MRLHILLENLPGVSGLIESLSHFEISGVTADPNLCHPGFLYLADESETVDSTRLGVRLDGREFISVAIKNGAVAILTTPGVNLPAETAESVALLLCEAPLSVLGAIASRLFGEPRPKHVAIVTGTNGKTSTVNFCRMLWSAAGIESCSIGNLGGVCSDGTTVWGRDPILSVPETVFLHKTFQELAGRGIFNIAMEATSHALFDYRLHGIEARVGAFTNLTRDHLDFHKNMEEYFDVKMKLFTEVLAPGSFAVLNADSDYYARIVERCKKRNHEIISFGWTDSAQIRLVSQKLLPGGQDLEIAIGDAKYKTSTKLFGDFQISNILCAIGIMIASGMSAETAVRLVSVLDEVEGRLNKVATTPTGGNVIVDYAHSPDAIQAALKACRTFTHGKLSIVFGANGGRDPGKRELMGEMAAQHADCVIVTDGHPRTEVAASIRKQVLSGAPGAREIGNRTSAIEYGIKALEDGDTLLIAGMGHENFQVIGDSSIPYSDKAIAQRIVKELSEK